MTWPTRLAATAVLTLTVASGAVANQWNDRTKLTFDAPIMIPGATLPPGTYTFRLMDSPVFRHMVQVWNEDETKLIATAQAIPTKRAEAKGDVVVKLNPTEPGSAIALKAWFYPGTVYGHEFVYSDQQARVIADRTKTLVLSTDVEGSDVQKGTLHTYDAEGRRAEWKPDAVTLQEWNAWRGSRVTAKVAAPGGEKNRDATAPMVRGEAKGTTVRVGDLEEHGSKYVGQTVSVTAEIEEVFGPRLFKIDEQEWIDFDGEVLVYLPSNFAALVKEEDQVTVTGTVRMMKLPEMGLDLEWLGVDAGSAEKLTRRPVLVADSIVGGNSNVALAIDVSQPRGGNQGTQGGQSQAQGTQGQSQARTDTPSGTSGSTAGARGTTGTAGTSGAAAAPLTDASALRGADRNMVGRQVDVDQVKVLRVEGDHGFWIETGGPGLFVLPADGQQVKPRQGQTVSIDGIILEMPRRLREKAREGNSNETIYIYAHGVK